MSYKNKNKQIEDLASRRFLSRNNNKATIMSDNDISDNIENKIPKNLSPINNNSMYKFLSMYVFAYIYILFAIKVE